MVVALGLGLLPAIVPGQSGPKILVAGVPEADLAELRKAAPRANLVRVADQKDALAQVGDADAVINLCSRDLVRTGKKLRWVQVGSAGVENCVFPEMVQSNITLTNAKVIQGPEIADHAMALLLSLTRKISELVLRKSREDWPLREYQQPDKRPIELNGRTALIIGLGGIGTQIAQRAAAFGMTVIGVDPKEIPMMSFVKASYPPDRLPDLLPEADVVFMSAPLTPQTQKMLGAEQFRRMKRGAYFIAVSRGRTYDAAALVKALDEKHLAGAGLDVTDPEPLPKGHPLWKFDNVVITPHLAGTSDKFRDRQMALFRENIRRFSEGLPLINVVDKQKGY
jgi:phosphoglycerate dehydrogenase-like enzyme